MIQAVLFDLDGVIRHFDAEFVADVERRHALEQGAIMAAMFAEPVMGAGGVLTPPKTYWEKIQKVLKKYDVLLVADEVICASCAPATGGAARPTA